jgi:hypothetical protein
MIQPQLYAISWARLLFGRVYVVTNSVLFRLWDYIFESTEGEGAVLESGHVETDAARLSTNQLSPLTGYDIRQPLLMKLACFILSLVLEVRFLSLSLSLSLFSSFCLSELVSLPPALSCSLSASKGSLGER